MTQYFDEKGRELTAIEKAQDVMALMEWERRLVFDCTVAAMLPTCPDDIATKIHATVLRYGVYSLPVNASEKDFESMHEHVRLLNMLHFDLHSHFHDIARGGFSDNPLAGLNVLYARGEEVREQMVEAEKKEAKNGNA
jgi:hypothetical protein